MIKVTRINDSELVVNADLIEFVEAIPDTIISLTTGKKIMVRETIDEIIERVAWLRRSEGVGLARRLHVLPDFHGNRSPLGDPEALGVVSGLTLDSDFDSLCRLYWRTAVGIALGVRHILETLAPQGYATDRLLVTGGHTRNPLLMEL